MPPSVALRVKGVPVIRILLLSVPLFLHTALSFQQPTDRETVIRQLTTLIEHEVKEKGLSSLSVALVDDQSVIWAAGFGMADPERKIPATEQTVYRVGSISKLFTDIGIMQLVERGEVDLDKPVSEYIPEFRPENPFSRHLTLRQLMSHRSGIVREPPLGSYFDASGTTMERAVASLNATRVVYGPESRIKYSNAGVTVAGYALEKLAGTPFERQLEKTVLAPLGMNTSAFSLTPELRPRLAKARMWGYDGRIFDAPVFELGTPPAGNLYSTVVDLAAFLRALFNGGKGDHGILLKGESLKSMTEIQFAGQDQAFGFGLGFMITRLDGQKRIGHGGAVYGYATDLSALPDEKLGVVVAVAMDVSNAVADKISTYALSLLRASKRGDPLPEPVLTRPLSSGLARTLEGYYALSGRSIDVTRRGEKLFVDSGGGPRELRVRSGDTLIVDDRIQYGPIVLADGMRLIFGRDTLVRTEPPKPQPEPERWLGLLGEYGWDHNILYILERRGKLTALIEWIEYDPLEELGENEFAFPNYNMYHGERLVFTRDASGRAIKVEAAGIEFPRRTVGPEGGATFTIMPLRPVAELEREARRASPPVESGLFRAPELVDLASLDPTIRFDVRYAGTNNFMKAQFYSEPRAFLQRPAAGALLRAHRSLARHGYGLLIHDAYRPWYVTKMFWDATPHDMRIFVADPAAGSRHNRGCAVDLTLYDLKTGQPVEMVSGYDEFSDRAFPFYPGGTSLQHWYRALLRKAMHAEGFEVYEWEWWHFDYNDWKEYPIQNVRFERIE